MNRILDLARPTQRAIVAVVAMLIAVFGQARAQDAEVVVRIACVGDSITEGTANADHATNSWPRILERMFDAEFPGMFETGNFGRSGATLLKRGTKPYWNQDVFAKGGAYRPGVVIINLGTNDATNANWLKHGDEFEEDYRDLIRHYRALEMRPTIWLSNLTPMYEPHPRVAECKPHRAEIEDIIKKLASEYKLGVIDFKAVTAGKPELFPDGLHPNTAGNELMAKAAFEVLTLRPAPDDQTIRPNGVEGVAHDLVRDGQGVGVRLGSWTQSSERVEGTGAKREVLSKVGLGAGDFHIRARLRMLGQKNSAAGFFLNDNFFGFEGARGTVFRNGTQMGGLRLLHPSERLWERDSWIDFEVIRNSGMVWFIVNGFVVDMASIPGAITRFGFDPTRSTMQISDWTVVGTIVENPVTLFPTEALDLPLIDLDSEEGRHVVVDREKGQYLGHVTTTLLEDGKTILAVYPKGHGSGPIVYKRSDDAGLTWSDRLPTPESWATSKEVPTIHRVIDPKTGDKRLIMWSGLYPARLATSEDDGKSWSELKPVGDWGGIVVMGFVERLKTGSYIAMFHDDGRFFTAENKRTNPPVFSLFKTFSHDGGLTWTDPETVWSGSDVHLCEPGCFRSPDGKTLAVLLRENSRTRNSHVIFSEDEGVTWSEPRELPASLTGDRHTGKYAPDGRLFISFRDTALESPTKGDWVGWVGTWEDILHGRPGQYRVRIKDNKNRWDSTYPGVEVLADGTYVVTTYGHWDEGEQPYILSARFTLEELDAKASLLPKKTDLFVPGMNGVHTYRIPALVTTNKGTLIASCDARNRSGRDLPNNIDTVIRRSTDGGKTWSDIQTIVDWEGSEGAADPCLVVDRQTGRIWCAVTWADGVGWRNSKPGYGDDSFHNLLLYSDDDGLTWSEPIDITESLKDPSWRSVWFSPGAGMQSDSGRLFIPFSAADGDGAMFTYAAVSDDHGKTWQRVGPMGAKTNEAMLAQLGDGTIVCNMRSVHGLNRRAVSRSTDNGDTWSPLTHHDDLVEPVCQGSMLTIAPSQAPDGREWLVFCNPASTKRNTMTVRVSFDGGRTWPIARLIHSGPASYSCMTLLPDGAIGVLYENGLVGSAEQISFARLPLEWLAEGDSK